MELDKYTKEMATEFANNEADHHGFKIGSNPWKKAFKEYCEEAKETMSVGRNPYMSNPTPQSVKPFFSEIFSDRGAAGEIAKHYTGEAMSTSAVEQRIMSAVTNLVKLFEAGKMGSRNKAKGKYGKILNSEMSEFQLPKKGDMSEAEYSRIEKEVLRKWLTRDLLTGFLIESLIPFFSMNKSEVDQMVSALIDVTGGTIKAYQEGGADSRRNHLFKNFTDVITPKMSKIDYYKMIFKAE